MNRNITIIVLLSNLLFYIGIFCAVLFLADDNSLKWLFVILCVVIGMIGSAIPKSMINAGIVGLNVNIVRMSILIKYFILIACVTLFDFAETATIIGICILFAADLFAGYLLLKSIYSKHITIKAYMESIKNYDTAPVNGIVKYLFFNILCILLFSCIHENIIEVTIMLIVCISVHLFASEKIIKKMSPESGLSRYKIRVVLWCFESIMIILAYFDFNMAVYIIFSVYYTIAADLLMQYKTSIFIKILFMH